MLRISMKREWQVSVAASILCHGLLLVALQQAWKQLQVTPAVHEDPIRIAIEWVTPTPNLAASASPQTPAPSAAEPPSAPKPETPRPIEPVSPSVPVAMLVKVALPPTESPKDPTTEPTAKQAPPVTAAAAELPSPINSSLSPAVSLPGATNQTADLLAKPGESAPAQFTAPTYRDNAQPAYPSMARRRGQQGSVLLRVEVTAEGHPARVRTSQSSGYPILDQAAVQAVSSWVFEPARLDAKPVPAEIEVPIHFRIGPSDNPN